MHDPNKQNPYIAPQAGQVGPGGPGGYMKPGRGGLILTFGILGLVFCGLFGIAAWAMGNTDLAEMRAGRMNPAEESLTNTGRILGMISCILMLVGVGFIVLIMIMGAATSI